MSERIEVEFGSGYEIFVDDETHERWLREEIKNCRALRKKIMTRAHKEAGSVEAEQRTWEAELDDFIASTQPDELNKEGDTDD